MSDARFDEHLADRRCALLVNAIIDYAIYMLDPEGRIVTWNPGAERQQMPEISTIWRDTVKPAAAATGGRLERSKIRNSEAARLLLFNIRAKWLRPAPSTKSGQIRVTTMAAIHAESDRSFRSALTETQMGRPS